MEVSGQLHAPAALPQGKSPWYPLDRRLGGPQNRFGRGGEEKNSQPPPGIEPYGGKLYEQKIIHNEADCYQVHSRKLNKELSYRKKT
jgi:hypothetical protein